MPTPEQQPDRALREAQLRAQLDGGLRLLLAELQQGQSDRLLQYLAFTARFHRYSASNQMLIFMQRPEATFVAGYRRWQELGHQVRKGEQGIRIYAPRSRQRINPETHEMEEQVRFVMVAVFDASQLADVQNRPLPTFFTPLGDDQQELYARLHQVVTRDGFAVTEEPLGRAQGSSSGGRIAIRAGLDSRNRVLTLLHEYTHELLHWNAPGRAQPLPVKECHAEAVSYVVAHHFGIHNPFSADYLQHWGATSQELLAELDVVRCTAAYIIDQIEHSPTSGDQPADVAPSEPDPLPVTILT